MKIFSVARPLSRAAARNCFLINQLATPGLGSLMAGRFIAGTGQVLLALAGFGLVLAWFISLAAQLYAQINSDDPPRPAGWLGELGAVAFAASWSWALLTSFSLSREARANEPPPPPRI